MTKFTLIIRPQPDSDRDVGWLNRYGVPALASPVIIGAPVLSASLAHDLGNPANFTGIIWQTLNSDIMVVHGCCHIKTNFTRTWP